MTDREREKETKAATNYRVKNVRPMTDIEKWGSVLFVASLCAFVYGIVAASLVSLGASAILFWWAKDINDWFERTLGSRYKYEKVSE